MTCAPYFTFDPTAFRASYPQFADPTVFPDATLQGYWDAATCYIANSNYGYLNGNARLLVLNLMAAHIGALLAAATDAATGTDDAPDTPGIVVSATIDKVTVTLQPPPEKDEFQWWMNQTAYGMQAYVLLGIKGAGGFFVGGFPVRAGFRR